MKIRLIGLCLGLSAFSLIAQEAIDAEKLNKQLKQLQETFEKQQAEMKANFEKLVREQQSQIDALKKQLEASTNAPPGTAGRPGTGIAGGAVTPSCIARGIIPFTPASASGPAHGIEGAPGVCHIVEGLTSTAQDVVFLLERSGYELLHSARQEPWGQTVARLISSEGVIVGVSYVPQFHP